MGIWGLWLDIDMQSPYRGRQDLPKNMADAIPLAMVPVQPSIIINSGYGIQYGGSSRSPGLTDADDRRTQHGWLVPERDVPPQGSIPWLGCGRRRTWSVSRVPGTLNRKGSMPVRWSS